MDRANPLATDLYCITAENYSLGRSNIEVVKQWIDAGIKVIQYREKDKDMKQKYQECKIIRELTKEAGVTFIVNDDIALAMMIGADGVHIGQDDLPLTAVRHLVGDNMIIGISIHSPQQAQAAAIAGADYIGVGPIYKTSTKKNVCQPVGLEYLEYVVNNISLPFVAIGGIKESNVAEVVQGGAQCIAMVTEITMALDIGKKISNLRKKIQKNGGENIMSYTTQMDAAKKGIVTKEMAAVAMNEKMDVAIVMDLVAQGKIAIPANKNHISLQPAGVGQGLSTKINVNLGVSEDCCDIEQEICKVKKAIELKADAIMDLSCFGKTREFRRRLIEFSPAMIGTVPMYDAVGFLDKELKSITAEEFLSVVEKHAEDGVDFMTIHAGLNKETAGKVKQEKRLTNIVSRGGSLLFAWMELNNQENPFYEHYDKVLDICAKYDVTISLGDACRPGCIQDATDAAQIQELIVLGELTKRAWAKNVQVIVEGPGHMPLNQITGNVMLQKKLCHGAPFYVLGPLVTDVAPGYDHITSAIGGAVAAAAGADFLCYVTPAEHLRLPTMEDMKEGIIAARIAAHAADIAKGVAASQEWDNQMSQARADIDFDKMIALSIDPEKSGRYRKESLPEQSDTCTMCGKMCAMKTMKKILNGEEVNI